MRKDRKVIHHAVCCVAHIHAVQKRILPARPAHYDGAQRVDPVDVFQRLVGSGQPLLAKELSRLANRTDLGAIGTINRVLHLAYRSGELVGACSSTVQPAWTPSGCGHWGLLAVALAFQGSGVASALVAAAEERLKLCGCSTVQVDPAFYPIPSYPSEPSPFADAFGLPAWSFWRGGLSFN